jgi:hypothetical protein
LQFFDFLSHRREQGRREFGIALLQGESLTIRVDPIQEIA